MKIFFINKIVRIVSLQTMAYLLDENGFRRVSRVIYFQNAGFPSRIFKKIHIDLGVGYSGENIL